MTPLWFESKIERDCRCGALIREGEPAAWLPGEDDAVCLDCGCTAEQRADKEELSL